MLISLAPCNINQKSNKLDSNSNFIHKSKHHIFYFDLSTKENTKAVNIKPNKYINSPYKCQEQRGNYPALNRLPKPLGQKLKWRMPLPNCILNKKPKHKYPHAYKSLSPLHTFIGDQGHVSHTPSFQDAERQVNRNVQRQTQSLGMADEAGSLDKQSLASYNTKRTKNDIKFKKSKKISGYLMITVNKHSECKYFKILYIFSFLLVK